MTLSPSPAVDRLLAAAHEAVTAAISNTGSGDLDHACDGADCYICDRLDWLSRSSGTLDRAADLFTRYSDGRRICADVEYQHGRSFRYVFPPVVEHHGERELTRLPLAPYDENYPSPGVAVIYVDDQLGTIRADLHPHLEVVE